MDDMLKELLGVQTDRDELKARLIKIINIHPLSMQKMADGMGIGIITLRAFFSGIKKTRWIQQVKIQNWVIKMEKELGIVRSEE